MRNYLINGVTNSWRINQHVFADLLVFENMPPQYLKLVKTRLQTFHNLWNAAT